jgi:hypothetical protein
MRRQVLGRRPEARDEYDHPERNEHPHDGLFGHPDAGVAGLLLASIDLPTGGMSRTGNQRPQQAAMAPLRVKAGRRAQEGQQLSTFHAGSESRNRLPLAIHLEEVATPVFPPGEWRPVFAIVVGV